MSVPGIVSGVVNVTVNDESYDVAIVDGSQILIASFEANILPYKYKLKKEVNTIIDYTESISKDNVSEIIDILLKFQLKKVTAKDEISMETEEAMKNLIRLIELKSTY